MSVLRCLFSSLSVFILFAWCTAWANPLVRPGDQATLDFCEAAVNSGAGPVLHVPDGRKFSGLQSVGFVVQEDASVMMFILRHETGPLAGITHSVVTGLSIEWANQAREALRSGRSFGEKAKRPATAHYNPKMPVVPISQEDKLLAQAEKRHRATRNYQVIGEIPIPVEVEVPVAYELMPVTVELLQSSPERIAEHNIAVMERNARYLNSIMEAEIARLDPWEAIHRIYEILNRDFILTHGDESPSLADQQFFYENRMRYDANMPVLFANFLPPHPRDIKNLLSLLCYEVDRHIANVQSTEDALYAAAWAKRRLTELQPGIDGNTRAGRAFFDYVITRTSQLKPHLPMMRFNLSSRSIQYEVVEYKIDGQTFAFSPFDSDWFKEDINNDIHLRLDAFSLRTKRPYYVVNRGDSLPVPADGERVQIVGPEILNLSVSDFSHDYYYRGNDPQWDTVRDFMFVSITRDNQARFRQDPSLRAEVERINAIMQNRRAAH